MDITVNELKIMKAKQLRRLVREAIEEVLKEGNTYAGKDTVDDIQKDPKFNTLSGTGKQDTLNKLKQGGSVTIGEGDIEEMARIAKGFRLADPQLDVTPYQNRRVSGTSLADVINFFRENPGAEKKQLQNQFNFVRPQIANAVVNALLDAGVLVKLGTGGEEEAPVAPGEEPAQQATDPEDLFMGSSENPLSMYFDDVPNDSGEEDFNTEEEPTVGDLETGGGSVSQMSDEDYDTWMKYSDLKQRLDATKSNILKTKRRKGSIGDISDKPSNELQRLRDLKKSLEDRIETLIQNSEYLQNKMAKDSGTVVTPPPIETPADEEEEEPISESFDDYDMKKLQYYAGIRK
jgi:hypothetical protein